MTNSGLYADLHQQMRELANLVDSVLVALKESANTIDSDRKKLAQALDTLAEENPEDLSDRLLSVILSSGQGDIHQKWRKLSKKLSTNQADESLLSELEQFAQLLEQRQSDALAKMRGWRR